MKCTNRSADVLVGLFVLATNLLICEANAQTFTTLKSFGNLTNVSGYHPQCQLVQGADGTLYGTAYEGEGAVRETVFKLQPDGSGFTTLKLLVVAAAVSEVTQILERAEQEDPKAADEFGLPSRLL